MTGFSAPPVFVEIAADQGYVECHCACLCRNGPPCLSGCFDRIDAIGDDNVAKTKVVGGNSLGDDISERTIFLMTVVGVESMLDRVDAEMDGVQMAANAGCDRRLSDSWQT
nr:hypothetical protein [Ferranicluibacter rubi]